MNSELLVTVALDATLLTSAVTTPGTEVVRVRSRHCFMDCTIMAEVMRREIERQGASTPIGGRHGRTSHSAATVTASDPATRK